MFSIQIFQYRNTIRQIPPRVCTFNSAFHFYISKSCMNVLLFYYQQIIYVYLNLLSKVQHCILGVNQVLAVSTDTCGFSDLGGNEILLGHSRASRCRIYIHPAILNPERRDSERGGAQWRNCSRQPLAGVPTRSHPSSCSTTPP